MKTAELNKIMNKLSLPDRFIKKGRLAYYLLEHKTGASILVGLFLDTSIDSHSFFSHYFVQCLYEPFSTYNLSLGDRIGSHWNKENITKLQEAIIGLDVYKKLNKFNDVVSLLENHPYYGEKTGRDICLALTYFILKEYDKSSLYLDKVISLKKTDVYCFFSEEIGNALLIRDCIINDDYERGVNTILHWQETTVKNIRL